MARSVHCPVCWCSNSRGQGSVSASGRSHTADNIRSPMRAATDRSGSARPLHRLRHHFSLCPHQSRSRTGKRTANTVIGLSKLNPLPRDSAVNKSLSKKPGVICHRCGDEPPPSGVSVFKPWKPAQPAKLQPFKPAQPAKIVMQKSIVSHNPPRH